MEAATGAAPQHMRALQLGNQVRLAGAAVRREIRKLPRAEGLRRCAELLECPPEAVLRLRVGHLVTAVHRVGSQAAAQALYQAGLTPPTYEKRVGQLTERQRLVLAEALRRRARTNGHGREREA